MKKVTKNIFSVLVIAFLGSIFWNSDASVHSIYSYFPFSPPDTTNTDDLKFKFKDVDGNPANDPQNSKLFLSQPKNIESDVEYDAKNNEYIFTNKIGDINYRQPQVMSFDEYKNYDFDRSIRKYWQQKAKGESSQTQSTLIPKLHVGGDAFAGIFGSNVIDIKPQGSATLNFGIKVTSIDNPRLDEKNRRTTSFDFEEEIAMNVTGQIGDKIKLNTQYNTKATFDFENKMNLSYDGKDDEIIKKIQAGDVNLPLSGSLITGSQSLFGLKTELQFGRMTVTSVLSQQKGKTQVIEVQGGAQTNYFEVSGDDYEANKHFFLAQYFYNNYEQALSNLPIINSAVTITKIEVWVTNKSGNYTDARNIVGFTELGESSGAVPDNAANTLYSNLVDNYSAIRNIYQITKTLPATEFASGKDYEKIENARKLEPSEYRFNPLLGYISLNSALNSDEVLAVAYEYSVAGDPKPKKVGEFSTDGITAPNTLILKLIRGTSLTPKYKNWNLMMKNVYSTGAYQVQKEGFELNIMYQNDKTGKALNYIPDGDINGTLLLKVLNLDNLNSQQDPQPDGAFDYIDGVTIAANNGKIIFPVLEPFGNYLRKQFNNDFIANKYVFEELYDSTQSKARQVAEKNKFYLTGKYSSTSSSEISLNAMNVPQGSVVVTAGGVKLTENQDYTVDYTLGRVKITNKGLLESGTPIKISLESNSTFAMQSKTFLGSRFDYKVSNDFSLGGTIINLTERPMTEKVSLGDEAISNTIWGIDGTYRTDVPMLTKIIDYLPFIETKEMSNVTITGEFAHLIPGHSNILDDKSGKKGISYIDDFEGTKSSNDVKSMSGWVFASTPQKNPLFPEGDKINSLEYGFNRAKLAWYTIDNLFLRNNSATPDHIKQNPELQSSHLVREIFEKEIYPNKDNTNNIATNMSVLNLSFYPNQKGSYNYDIDGIDANGKLLNPNKRWGGIMRSLQTTDFEESNIEYIEFWLMDPFVENQAPEGGDLYINLGDVSEDILKDSRKSFENGMPTNTNQNSVDTTNWGLVPVVQPIVKAFDNDESSRSMQDIGFDGLINSDEKIFFSNYLNEIENKLGFSSKAYQSANSDPSNDNYHYFKGTDYDEQKLGIIERYKNYNLTEGNSPTAKQSTEDYQTTGTSLPDVEDINNDNTLSEAENYFQYKIPLRSTEMNVGSHFITDKLTSNVTFENGIQSSVNWYQFKVPITEFDASYGDISDFKSIRFMRMFLHNFEDSVTLRFATLDLVRGEWRKYTESFNEGIPDITIPETEAVAFDISAVNIEENGKKTPVNYILPPDIDRSNNVSGGSYYNQLNEQSIVLKVCNLSDGDAKAAYKNVNLDIRQYKNLQMFVHAEAVGSEPLNNGDLCAFIRIGSDYQNNFYEYEIPLSVTPAGYYDDNTSNRNIVWPIDNTIDFKLELLLDAKEKRNEAMRQAGSSISYNTLYTYSTPDGKARIRLTGNPNLSNIKTILIGVRNRSKFNNTDSNDDGLPKCAEIWMNELRVYEFDEKTGWAANARMTTKLADFGTVTLAGSTMKPGFGGIEEKVSERNKEEINQFDLSSNFELGKFFPEKAKVSIPMYFGYSTGVKNPFYNPLDPDVPLKDALENAATKAEKDSIKHSARDYTQRKSLNFTNVKINNDKAPKIWDVSNFAVNYSYSEVLMQNVSTDHNLSKNYRGGFVYNFSTTPKVYEPLKKLGFLKSNSLRLIKDFNFSLPQQLSFRTDMDRQYSEVQLKSIGTSDVIDPFFNKNFLWNRNYDFKWNITKSLKFDFTAANQARIDEPEGLVSKENPDSYKVFKDSVWSNIQDWGRTTNYNHSFNITYNVPLNKIPMFNWISSSLRYNGNYDWIAGPRTKPHLKIGNTIKNSNSSQANATLNMKNLYNKVPYLKNLDQNRKKKQSQKSKPKTTKVNYEELNVTLKENTSKTITHNLNTEDGITVKVTDEKGTIIEGETEIISGNKIKFTSKTENKNVKIVVTGNKPETESILKQIVDNSLILLTSINNVNLTYSSNKGTLLPGYSPEAHYLGLNNYTPDKGQYGADVTRMWAPGFNFISGFQDDNFADYAGKNQWLSTESAINSPYSMTNTINWQGKVTLEPIQGLKIDLNTTHNKTNNNSSNYYADANNNFNSTNYMEKGTFSMSVISINTAFDKISIKTGYNSEAFEKFKTNRLIIAERLAENHDPNDIDYNPDLLDAEGFPDGYSSSSQEVMTLAFLSAYTNFDAKKMSLSSMPIVTKMRPNWTITYNGLNKLKFLKKFIKSANIRHSYRSSYNVGSFLTNLDWKANDYVRDIQNINFISQHEVGSVSIAESFSPLISVDVTLSNTITTKFEIKKQRNITLSLSNSQIAEMKSNEFVVGLGYRIKDVKIYITSAGNKKEYKSDLTLRADFSIKDNVMVTHKIEEDVHQATSGQSLISFKNTADYVMSERFNIQIYFDYTRTNPIIATTFKQSTTSFGVSVRFTLM